MRQIPPPVRAVIAQLAQGQSHLPGGIQLLTHERDGQAAGVTVRVILSLPGGGLLSPRPRERERPPRSRERERPARGERLRSRPPRGDLDRSRPASLPAAARPGERLRSLPPDLLLCLRGLPDILCAVPGCCPTRREP